MKLAATARLSLALGLPRGVAFGLMRLRACSARCSLGRATKPAGATSSPPPASCPLLVWL